MENKYKLKELFDKRHVFEEYNNNVPKELNNQIEQADKNLINILHDLQMSKMWFISNTFCLLASTLADILGYQMPEFESIINGAKGKVHRLGENPNNHFLKISLKEGMKEDDYILTELALYCIGEELKIYAFDAVFGDSKHHPWAYGFVHPRKKGEFFKNDIVKITSQPINTNAELPYVGQKGTVIGFDKKGLFQVVVLGHCVLCNKDGLELEPSLFGSMAATNVMSSMSSSKISSEINRYDENDTIKDSIYEKEYSEDDSIKRNKSIGFTVKFADGKIIQRKTARSTMIAALKYMGLEKASKYRGEMFKGYPLISKLRRTDKEGKWQKNVDGWWIYVNMNNQRAITCIKGVAEMLKIPIAIEMDRNASQDLFIDRPKGTRAKFSLNGGEPACKNRTVWNTVRKLIKELPTATFKEISDFFPKSLQGSYGVVATVNDVEERSKRNQSESGRWFLDPRDILKSADGVRFTVSTEWGHNFNQFRNHVMREFGWTIEEA